VHEPGRVPLVIDRIGPGQAVGWSWMFPPVPVALRCPRSRACRRHLGRRRMLACKGGSGPGFRLPTHETYRRGDARPASSDSGPAARRLRARCYSLRWNRR
jgi:hypothetical protein